MVRELVACVAVVSLVASSAGCGEQAPPPACGSVFAAANAGLARIRKEQAQSEGDGTASTARANRVAEQYERLAVSLGGIEVTDVRLRKAVAEYVDLSRSAARGARAYAKAVDRRAGPEIDATRAAVGRAQAKLDTPTAWMNNLCSVGGR